MPAAGFEVQEQRFFPLAMLPEDAVSAVPRRIAEIAGAQGIAQHW
jgi:hypothetical protein